MSTLLRHLLSIFLLPFVVVVVVPIWLLTAFSGSESRWGESVGVVWAARIVGGVVLLAGFLLFSSCVALFARVGKGTLAPWDPTKRLVAVGPYRHVRNPMISGVAMMLTGEALLCGSWRIAIWAGMFVIVNHVYFVLVEEPGLERRFGESYRDYKRNVRRWIPRLSVWSSP